MVLYCRHNAGNKPVPMRRFLLRAHRCEYDKIVIDDNSSTGSQVRRAACEAKLEPRARGLAGLLLCKPDSNEARRPLKRDAKALGSGN
jgi:hypothetical protein